MADKWRPISAECMSRQECNEYNYRWPGYMSALSWPSCVIFRNVHYYNPTYNCFLTKLSRRRVNQGGEVAQDETKVDTKLSFSSQILPFESWLGECGSAAVAPAPAWPDWLSTQLFHNKVAKDASPLHPLSITLSWCNMEAHYAQYADNCHKSSVNVDRVYPPSWPESPGSSSSVVTSREEEWRHFLAILSLLSHNLQVNHRDTAHTRQSHSIIGDSGFYIAFAAMH